MSFIETIVSAVDNYPLSVRVYEAENPKGVVKVIHGMEEHQLRYEDLANFLSKNGYIVVTADLRGHGKNAQFLSHIADKAGEKLIIEDEKKIMEFINEKYPGLPVTLLGHSMGAIIARVLIQTESAKFDKMILSGYPNYQGAVKIAVVLAKLTKLFKGPKGYSNLLTNLSLGAYAKAIEDSKTKLDWLSFNEENVSAYDKDPLCGEEFTVASYIALFKLLNQMNKFRDCKNMNKNLSVLLLSGIKDPCVGGEKGKQNSFNTLRKYGITKIETKVFDNMRHEILKENNYQKVYQTILSFLNKK